MNQGQELRRSAPRSSKKEVKVGSHIPDRWPYWLAKVADDPAWRRVTIGGLVKLAQETSVDAVSAALSFAFEDGIPDFGNPYGWLRQTARELHGTPRYAWAGAEIVEGPA